MKRENGITLIALIITVIILLILAGTAVSIAINGGDIFTKTSSARSAWNTAVQQEEASLNSLLKNEITVTVSFYDPFGSGGETKTITAYSWQTWEEWANDSSCDDIELGGQSLKNLINNAIDETHSLGFTFMFDNSTYYMMYGFKPGLTMEMFMDGASGIGELDLDGIKEYYCRYFDNITKSSFINENMHYYITQSM